MEPPIWGCSLPKALNENLATLTAQFEKATAEKIKCQQEADETNKVINLANRYHANIGSEAPGQAAAPWHHLVALTPRPWEQQSPPSLPKLKDSEINWARHSWGEAAMEMFGDKAPGHHG